MVRGRGKATVLFLTLSLKFWAQFKYSLFFSYYPVDMHQRRKGNFGLRERGKGYFFEDETLVGSSEPKEIPMEGTMRGP